MIKPDTESYWHNNNRQNVVQRQQQNRNGRNGTAETMPSGSINSYSI